MKTQKISLNIEDEIYYKVKRDALEKRTTMSKIIRGLLKENYRGKNATEKP